MILNNFGNNKIFFIKRLIRCLFVILLIINSLVIIMPNIKVGAYSSHTQQEALNWVRNQVGKGIDYDGIYGNQCVDLIKAYYAYLGVSPVGGNGSDYTSNSLPSGWQRIKGASPKPGDILVYTGGYNNYGHVAIYEADRITYHQNFDNHPYIEKITYAYNGLSNPYWGVIRPDFTIHTHNYTSSITKQPSCTETGIRTYTCSCGDSYTESIAAKGHNYISTIVPPTTTDKGYTSYVCSYCQNNYKDNYVNPPELKEDGWYYCDALPSDVSKEKYIIEYNNYYEKIQSSSPGADWNNEGVVKSEWQNTGNPYKSAYDLQTSDSRVLVSSIYYHFCGPNAGNEGNYEFSGKFVHYDWLPADWVTANYLGDDNGHPYYFLYWSDGAQVYCKTGDTCDGTYGTHSSRCRAWYKENTYQDRIKIELYKFVKNSGWSLSEDTSATSVKIRYRAYTGDVNLDNKITISDAVVLKQYLTKSIDFTDEQYKTADLNSDCKINVFDWIALKRMIINQK